MINQPILLFCQYFPYKGGEQFLFNEAEYYPVIEDICVYTQYNKPQSDISLPSNIRKGKINFDNPSSVRDILKRNWKLIFEVFYTEVLNSPHRFRYVRYFKTHFILLIGYLQKAERINEQLPEGDRVKLYSYWFDEWATVIHLVKRISRKKVSIICRIHGYDFDEAQVEKGYHLFRSFDLNGFDKIVSVSEYGKKYVENRYHFERIEINRLGVKDKGDNPLNTGGDKMVVSCSALIPLKRVHLIIRLLNEMKADITWVHFGDGPLEKLILDEADSLPPNIKFDFRGQVDNQEILAFYRDNTVDLFMNVSELEGIPVSIMEAISFGIPILGCNICGVPEIVNERTGILLEKDFNIIDTTKKIEDFLKNKSRDNTFRSGVKNFWRINFNADFNYPGFIDKYLLN